MTSQPDWLRLVDDLHQDNLTRLLETAPRSREEQAHTMLVAPPWPADQTDAQSRVSAVIRYLTSGYRVGDSHPTTELTEAG